MKWFERLKKGINTETKDKKEIQEGLWFKCPTCKELVSIDDHKENLQVCSCGYHERVNSKAYFDIFFDNKEYTEINSDMKSGDPLKFTDTKDYATRLEATIKKSGLNDALTSVYGTVDGNKLMIASMNFEFIGGSMGSVVGEKIAKAIDFCVENKYPLMIISKSGGARMMEAAFSLMQMAKTSAKLTQLSDAKLPYISFLTDPTTGGITASYAMLGDVNITEPGALIGFAGPRVIKETIGRDLPEGFQRSEFVQEHGFIDYIIERKNLKTKVAQQLKMFAD